MILTKLQTIKRLATDIYKIDSLYIIEQYMNEIIKLNDELISLKMEPHIFMKLNMILFYCEEIKKIIYINYDRDNLKQYYNGLNIFINQVIESFNIEFMFNKLSI